ncbi:MOB kinase activator-like 2 isoform X2 [Culicoides brevitarsis]|uniref:MOB kinase activator-like 2 isoform X2 n=1 Tax=Culicoides brevitarsis TaxID=469753 RepID=UPI00307B27B0
MLRSPAHIAVGPTSGAGGMILHQTPPPHARTSLFDSCHRKIRFIGSSPFALFGTLVAKARRKDTPDQKDTKLYLEESVLERKLPDADLRVLVDIPAGLDYNEWLASHTLALFEHVNLVYGTISEFCTTSGCPDMIGPGSRQYLWFDEKGKKTRVAAPQYIDYVMTFTQKTVSDESIFPTKYANEFPSSFESIARKILRLLFHVIAHMYAAHFREVALLGLHAHLNLTFAHLTALHRRFNLIDPKETEVLRDLEIALHLTDESVQQQPTGGASDSVSITTAGSTITSSSGIGGTDTSCLSDNTSMTQIDGDAMAQPICKQPLESGNDPVSLISSHHNNMQHEQAMSCSGDASTTFSETTTTTSDKGGGSDALNAHLQSAA